MAISAIGDLLFDVNAEDGMIARRGGNPVISRASTGGYRTRYGIYHQMPAGKPRVEYRRIRDAWNLPKFDPYYGKTWLPTLLLEPSRTNICIRSEEFDTADWEKFASATVTANLAIAPDGTLTADKVEDANTTGAAYIRRLNSNPIGINDYVVASVHFKKVSSPSKFPRLWLETHGSGVANATAAIWLNEETGETSVSGGTVVAHGAIDMGEYWRFWLVVQNNGQTGNTNANFEIYPAYGSTFGTASTAATGSSLIWGAQVEVGQFPSAYIPTTTAAVTRSQDLLYYDEAPAPQAMTVYAEFILGSATTDTQGIISVGSTTNTDPKLIVYQGGGNWTLLHSNDAGGWVYAQAAFGESVGQRVELLGELFSDGSVQIHKRVNGGSVTSSTRTATLAFPANWNSNQTMLGALSSSTPGMTPFRKARIVKGTGHTMDDLSAIVAGHNSNLIRAKAA